jgi:hypothetical protein
MTQYLIHYKGKGRFIEVDPQASSDDYGKLQADFAREAGANEPEEFADMVRIWPDQQTYGIRYDWGLAGPDGAWFCLYPMPATSKETIERAKAHLRATQDVVSLHVTRITKVI